MNITKQERGVVVAITLASAGRKRLKWLYRGLEAVARAKSAAILSSAYGHVVMIPGAATSGKLTAAVDALGRQVEAVDVVLVVHGIPHKLVFADNEEIWADTLAKRLAAGSAGGKLRLLYSTACFGESHADDFVRYAFATAIGAKRQCANGVSEFETLLNAWCVGDTVSQAVSKGDRFVQRVAWDLLARTAGGFREVDSEKVIVGDIDTTVHLAVSSNRTTDGVPQR